MVLQARSKDVASLQKNSVRDFVRRSRERWIPGLWLSFAWPSNALRWYWTEQRQTPKRSRSPPPPSILFRLPTNRWRLRVLKLSQSGERPER
jgi:hypothetical protein